MFQFVAFSTCLNYSQRPEAPNMLAHKPKNNSGRRVTRLLLLLPLLLPLLLLLFSLCFFSLCFFSLCFFSFCFLFFSSFSEFRTYPSRACFRHCLIIEEEEKGEEKTSLRRSSVVY